MQTLKLNHRLSIASAILVALSVAAWCGSAIAQPGGHGDRGGDRGGYSRGGPPGGGGGFGGGPPGGGYSRGGPPGGGFGGGPPGGSSSGSDRMTEMLKASDTNHDGKIDLKEVPEYRRGFVKMMFDRMGIDSSKPVAIDAIRQKMAGGTSGRSSGEDQKKAEAEKAKAQQNADPLVPGFGFEQAFGSVSTFGVRIETPKNEYMSAGNGGKDPAKYREYAKGAIARYDRNKNGVIDRDETEGMRSDPKTMDRNHDGKINMDEMVYRLMNYDRSREESSEGDEGPDSADRYAQFERFRSQGELFPEGTPDWFIGIDTSKDGNVSMMEYSREWNGTLIDEFCWWDENNDGVITPKECLRGLEASQNGGYTVNHPEPPPMPEDGEMPAAVAAPPQAVVPQSPEAAPAPAVTPTATVAPVTPQPIAPPTAQPAAPQYQPAKPDYRSYDRGGGRGADDGRGGRGSYGGRR